MTLFGVSLSVSLLSLVSEELFLEGKWLWKALCLDFTRQSSSVSSTMCNSYQSPAGRELEGNLSARGSVVTAVNSVPPERESPLTWVICRLGNRDWPGSCLCVWFCFLPKISQHHGQSLRFTVEQDVILGIVRYQTREKKGRGAFMALVTWGGQSEWERPMSLLGQTEVRLQASGVWNRTFSPWVNCQWELVLLLCRKKRLGLPVRAQEEREKPEVRKKWAATAGAVSFVAQTLQWTPSALAAALHGADLLHFCPWRDLYPER